MSDRLEPYTGNAIGVRILDYEYEYSWIAWFSRLFLIWQFHIFAVDEAWPV